MQKDERDLLEVLKFDLVEETVGSWLRAIIHCLEKEQAAIRRDQRKEPTSSHETLGGRLATTSTIRSLQSRRVRPNKGV